MNITGYWETRQIKLDGKLLSSEQSRGISNHSPDGFNWSYAGSGPSQLALAILLTRTDKDTALKLYQKFKFQYIANLPPSNFDTEIPVDEFIIENGGGIQPSEIGFGIDPINQTNTGANCGPFYERCVKAQSDKCNCACGGINHGKARIKN